MEALARVKHTIPPRRSKKVCQQVPDKGPKRFSTLYLPRQILIGSEKWKRTEDASVVFVAQHLQDRWSTQGYTVFRRPWHESPLCLRLQNRKDGCFDKQHKSTTQVGSTAMENLRKFRESTWFQGQTC